MGKGKKIAIGTGIAAVAFFAFVFIVAAFSQQLKSDSVSSAQTTIQESSGSSSIVQSLEKATTSQDKGTEFVPNVIKRTIVNEKFTVSAGAYKVYPFFAPKDATDVSVNGNFTAAKDGIAVGLEDEYNFNLFKQGRTLSFAGDIYYSANGGKQNSGTIQTPVYDRSTSIRGEPLYLIFNNKKGDAEVNVEAIIELSYTQYQQKS